MDEVGLVDGRELFDLGERYRAGAVAMGELLACVKESRDVICAGQKHEQYSHAHGNHDTQLLLLVDGQLPNDAPRQQRQDDIHGARVCGRKDVVVDDELLGPAGALQHGPPQLLGRGALDVGGEGGEAQGGVDGDDDEPDEAARPALGDAQDRDGKRRLAEHGRQDGEEAARVGHEQKGLQVLGVKVPDVLPVADADVERDERGLRGKRYLFTGRHWLAWNAPKRSTRTCHQNKLTQLMMRTWSSHHKPLCLRNLQYTLKARNTADRAVIIQMA